MKLNLFLYLYWTFRFLLLRIICAYALTNLYWDILFLSYQFAGILSICWPQILYKLYALQLFFFSLWLLILLYLYCLLWNRSFNFNLVKFSNIPSWFGLLKQSRLRNSSHFQVIKIVSYFFFWKFTVLFFTFRSFIHMEFIFCIRCDVRNQLYFFHMYIISDCPRPFIP